MKFGFYTLGCKTNQFETQAMERFLTERGHEVGSFESPCDGYIINTCSVTAVADKKNRAVIRRCRRENPEAVIGVCGCYTQHAPEAVRTLGVDVIGGSAKREEFIEKMLEAVQKKAVIARSEATWQSPGFSDSPMELLDNALSRREYEVLPAGGLEERTRAMLKVQDGCVNFCSYCIIPYTRGPIRSEPLETAVRQARELEARGYREIVITGIEIAGWGRDLPGKPPVRVLIEAICDAVPSLRIRLGSLEPRIVTEEFCAALAGHPNLCPQFHLSMQSGCDTVLQRMRRKYDTARYLESLELLRKYFPGCAVTTDMIVAFPGETEEEFRQSLEFIQKCAFAEMHIFPYSRRPGTPAADMPGQLGNAVKEERSRAAIAVAWEMNRSFREGLVGSVQEVLFEEEEGGLSTGHAKNYIRVWAEGTGLHNEIRSVKITALYQDGLLGEIQEE
ncbi:MAG: tRNA (N(6)-L-threonylcarbamoyladenosine(37)-C(2))-methylthiotransferase MtaB [Candidatus Faecousia sp.]|nr:tRNA (N(6)-L-threonylcarbamoyladenosine(37)-C(2))-methylthiotransferase MtaB [Candidatus Faecousia sp.]